MALKFSIKLLTAPFQLLFFLGLGTGGVFYLLASKQLAKRHVEDPRETVGQREVESLTRGKQWLHLPRRKPERLVPTAFAALGVFTWPLLAWRYGFLRSALICVPSGVFQVYGLCQILGLDSGGTPILWKLLNPVCLAGVALLVAHMDTSWRKGQLQRRGWVSQGCFWVSRAGPTRGRFAHRDA